MKARLVLGLLACAASAWGGYAYDFYGSNPPAQPTVWAVNGASLAFAYVNNPDGDRNFQNYTTYNYYPGSASNILRQTVSGTNPNDYEVWSQLAFTYANSGIVPVHFLRASSTTVQAGVGSYISVEVLLSGVLNINQCVNGVVTQLSSASIQVADGMQLRTIIYGTNLLVFTYVDTNWGGYNPPSPKIWNLVASQQVPLTTGSPGFGSYIAGTGGNSGTGFYNVAVGRHDTVAPNAISHAAISTSAFPTDVSFRWPTTTDDSSGVGIWQYLLKRDDVTNSQLTVSHLETDDATVAPGTTYTWEVGAEDFHGNVAWTPITITTPAAQAIDPHRPGLRSTGSYWGGGGEQIDTLSGNLNFVLPVGTVRQRSGASIPVNLVYNSQNWREDGGVNWQLGTDVGYGYGWRMQIGSLTPFYNSWTSGVHHYVFTDGTGAEYRLTVNNGSVWNSTDGIHVWFDSGTNRIHFPDGSWWLMGCTSATTEPDAGTMYPTVMEDVSGNVITAQYLGTGSGLTYTNASSRLTSVVGPTETIGASWNSDSPIPHATSVGSPQGVFQLHYTSASLSPPFGSDPAFANVTTAQLTSAAPGGGNPYSFAYDPSGSNELTQVTFPFGGHLRWTYANDAYSDARMLRTVSNRYLAADSAGATEWSYGISWDNASGATVHGSMTVSDAAGIGTKMWNFTTANSLAPWQTGLVSQFVQQASQGGTVLQRDTYSWSQDGSGNPYISAKQTVMNEGTASQTSSVSQQTQDQFGNVTQAVQYPYNSTASPPLKVYNNTYLTGNSWSGSSFSGPSYASNYIFNRLVTTTFSLNGGTAQTLTANYYDGSPCPTPGICFYSKTSSGAFGSYANYPPSPSGYDSFNALPFNAQGLLSYRVTPAGSTSMHNYDLGTLFYATRGDDGTTIATYSSDSSVAYSAPTSISTQSYSDTISYTPWLAITQSTGSNGESVSMTYDAYGRPATSVAPFGETLTYHYSAIGVLPGTQTQTTSANQAATRTTLDGLGRVVKVETGTQSGSTFTTISSVDIVYAPCACSPLGKISKVSMPYGTAAPNNVPHWTVYTYDGLGRTLAVQQPDGASTTTTSYAGNQTTTTDPAGNWKQFTTDVSGNITTVVEPDPASTSGGTLTSSYVYDWMNHLAQVTMIRNGVTQTRTFVYDNAGRLTSATNPENGTVLYYYNTDNTLQYKHDAKGQDTVYTYDTKKRVTTIQRFPTGKNNSEDQCQRASYWWDTSPTGSGFTTNYGLNRITQVQYGSGSYVCVAGTPATLFTENYEYTPQGPMATKRFQVTRNGGSNSVTATWTYNSQGKVSAVTYPGYGASRYTYSFDTLGRPITLTDNGTWGADPDSGYPGVTAQWVKNAQYDYAGRMSSMQYLSSIANNPDNPTMAYETEAMGYNVNGQLASLGWSGAVTGTISYTYSTTQNNGQITQVTDGLSGETITYQYDALKRLVSASSAPTAGSSPAAWNEAYTYDGFGNLTGKSLNSINPGVNAGTNQVTGASYDANGNMTAGVAGLLSGGQFTYDVANRMVTAQTSAGSVESFLYTPDSKQVYRKLAGSGAEEITLYGASGEKLAVFSVVAGYYLQILRSNVYFAGKMIWSDNAPVYQDRLGTNRASGARFRPYGDEITSTSNEREKFATYTRDGYTGLDYAQHRNYASTYGRFNTPDPTFRSLSRSDPESWNLYRYTANDPVNQSDPTGLCAVMISGITMGPGSNSAWDSEAAAISADTAYPYQGLDGTDSVYLVAQQAFKANAATYAALNAIDYALVTNVGSVDIVAYSGGAAAFTAAYGMLSAAQKARIGLVQYLSPGSATQLANVQGTTSVVQGIGGYDWAATGWTQIPQGVPIYGTTCEHTDIACLFGAASSKLSAIAAKGPCDDPQTYTRTSPGGTPSNPGIWTPVFSNSSWDPPWGVNDPGYCWVTGCDYEP